MIEYAGVRIACVLATFLSCVFLVGFGSHTSECDKCLLAVPRRLGRMLPRSIIEGQGERAWDKHNRDYLSMCIILQNQHKDVREWVAHHHSIGASTIYLYDHRSEPPLRDLLTDFIDSGVVQYTWWNRSWDNYNYTLHHNPQLDVYAECLKNKATRHQFMGFLDSDEFLVLKDKSFSSVPDLLRSMMKQQEIGGLAVHWRVFGSSGHRKTPKEGILQAFTKCTPEDSHFNAFVKTLTNLDYTVRNAGHIFDLNTTDVSIVNENFMNVTAGKSLPSTQTKIAVHHYMIKSLEEFKQKQARGGGSGRKRGMGMFASINNASTETCLDAVHYDAIA